MKTVSFEQLDIVRQQVNDLVPGYYIKSLDPVKALETGQGNCFTNAMIASAVVSLMFDYEPSVVWCERLHATPKGGGFFETTKQQPAERNIGHIEMVVPRSADPYDVLALGYGLNVRSGHTFLKEDYGGEIVCYNDLVANPNQVPEYDPAEAKLVVDVTEDDPIITLTENGRGDRLLVDDWQLGGETYLAALDVPAPDFELLRQKTACFLAAQADYRRSVAEA